MLYARSLPALVEMIETLSWELHQIGLQLNAAKSKYSQQNSWITQCMLKCRRIWCMFFMRGLPTSILADTSLGT